MPPIPIDLLSDRLDRGDEGPTSVELSRKANEPATEAYVDGKLARHSAGCWTQRLRWWLAFCAGGVFVGQVAAVWIVHSSIGAARAEVQKIVRDTVDQVLKEKKLLGLEAQAQPAAEAVASLRRGVP
jgi:hypothetical protein